MFGLPGKKANFVGIQINVSFHLLYSIIYIKKQNNAALVQKLERTIYKPRMHGPNQLVQWCL